MRRSLVLATAGIALLMAAGSAMAQGVDLTQSDTTMQGLLDLIKAASDEWGPRLQGYAMRLLFGLAVIQLVWTFTPMVFQRADIGEIVHELIKFVLTIGFFAALITYSTEWAGAIVNSFRQAGAHAANLGSQGLMPGDMFALAVELADVVGSAETWNPGSAVMIALAGLVVLLCFAFMAAFMFVTLVEAYVIINAAVLLIGFGGSQWTREYAIAPLRFAVAVGAKLFVLTLIIGIVLSSAHEWQAAYNQNSASMWTMVGLSLVCAYLTKTIPELIHGMISGTSMGGGATIGSMAATALALGAGAGALGAAGAVGGSAAGAAGGTAAGAGGAGSASGSGGLANLIDSSLSGGHHMTTAAGGMSSSPLSDATGATANRVGGGGSPVSSARASVASGPQQAAQTVKAAQEKRQGATQNTTDSSSSVAVSAVNLAGGLVRSVGTLAAISVPGMEGAAAVGGGLPPRMPADDAADVQDRRSDAPSAESESNTIRPAPVLPGSLASVQVPGMTTLNQQSNNDTKGERKS